MLIFIVFLAVILWSQQSIVYFDSVNFKFDSKGVVFLSIISVLDRLSLIFVEQTVWQATDFRFVWLKALVNFRIFVIWVLGCRLVAECFQFSFFTSILITFSLVVLVIRFRQPIIPVFIGESPFHFLVILFRR